MRRYLWSRNLKNEEAMASDGPQRHKKKLIKLVTYIWNISNMVNINHYQHLLIHLLTYLLTYSLTHLLTYLLTYLHCAEFFLRS